MIVFRLTKSIYAHDLSGKGAEMAGGRWNNKGTALLYTSSSRSLCLAESLVHLPSDILMVNFSMVTLEVPDVPVYRLSLRDMPDDWRTIPAPASTRGMGDHFVKANQYLLMQLPSVIVPEEYNFLINPRHPESHRISIIHTEPFTFDSRFFKS